MKTRPMPGGIRVDVVAAAELSDEDARALEALDAAVHPPKPRAQKAASQREWARPQWHIMIRDLDDQLVSHVGAVTRHCLCDNKEILVGGLGDVMTLPSRRRKGYAGAGIRRATEFLRQDLQVDMSLLFCAPRLRSYYRRFGFRSFAGDIMVRQHGAETLFPRDEIMVMPGRKPLPECALLDLCGLPW